MSSHRSRLALVSRLLLLALLIGFVGMSQPSAASAQGPASIRTDKQTYRVGEPITICYTVPGPGPTTITDTQGGRSKVILQGVDDGRGDCLRGLFVEPPAGQECFRLQWTGTRGGSAMAQTCITVVDGSSGGGGGGNPGGSGGGGSQPSPVTIAVSVDRSEYLVGDQQTLCVTTSRPVSVRLINSVDGTVHSTRELGVINGRQCSSGQIGRPVGDEVIRVEALENGAVVAANETRYRSREQQQQPPPPTCTPGASGVVLYELPNYQGRCVTLTEDIPVLANLNFNDLASSIRFVGSYAIGWEAVIYQHTGYNGGGGAGGTVSTFRGDDPDFGDDAIGHDQASAVRLRASAGCESLVAYIGSRDRSAIRTWAQPLAISQINRCVASLNQPDRNALAAVLLESAAENVSRQNLLSAMRAILNHPDLGFYAEIWSFSSINLDIYGDVNAATCERGVGLLSKDVNAGNIKYIRDLLMHESFHVFACVYTGVEGALNEGAGIWVYMMAFPEDYTSDEFSGGWSEAVYGTKNFYRDILGVPEFELSAAINPAPKLKEFLTWLASRDPSGLPWNSSMKLISCYDRYYKTLNRAASDWSVRAREASRMMSGDASCRPD